MKVSLLIAVYNRADFLEKIFASLLHQVVAPFETIICEDGENPAMEALIKRWSSRFPFPIVHVHHPDKGNRKTLCVNKGILRSQGDYIITIDGDCVLHPQFIAKHIELSDDRCFLTGRRVELSEKASEVLSADQIERGYLNGCPLALYWDAVFGETRHLGRFFMTPKPLRKILGQNKILDIRGCNFSVHKKHLIAVNGYDNNFSGAYGEDSDLEFRLRNLGLQMKSVRGAAIQYHLWHKTQTHDHENQVRLEKTRALKLVEAASGLREAEGL